METKIGLQKIVLVASPGGHFVQLSLLAEELPEECLVVVGTYAVKPKFMPGSCYEQVPDFNRNSFYKAFEGFWKSLRIIKKHKPQLVVTTGAAPGLMMLFVSKMLGVQAVWIDSLANSNKLSLSGAIAKKIGGIVLSQWETVASDSEVLYRGRVI